MSLVSVCGPRPAVRKQEALHCRLCLCARSSLSSSCDSLMLHVGGEVDVLRALRMSRTGTGSCGVADLGGVCAQHACGHVSRDVCTSGISMHSFAVCKRVLPAPSSRCYEPERRGQGVESGACAHTCVNDRPMQTAPWTVHAPVSTSHPGLTQLRC